MLLFVKDKNYEKIVNLIKSRPSDAKTYVGDVFIGLMDQNVDVSYEYVFEQNPLFHIPIDSERFLERLDWLRTNDKTDISNVLNACFECVQIESDNDLFKSTELVMLIANSGRISGFDRFYSDRKHFSFSSQVFSFNFFQ